MNTWTERELQALSAMFEVSVTIARPDGGTHGPVTLWHGLVNDDLYVRSASGARAAWFSCAVSAGRGVMNIDGTPKAVRFQVTPAETVPDALDEVLHRTYDAFTRS